MFFRETLLKKVFALVVVFIYVLTTHLLLFPERADASQMVCYVPNGPIRSTPQYNPQSGFCETWPLDEYNTCPERYTYNQWLNTCIDLPRCTGANVYDLGSRSCVPIGEETQQGSGQEGTAPYDNICAIDLNGDDEITEDELAQCITADDGGSLCPLDAAPCRARYTTPDCPQGYTYNGTTKTCQSNPRCESGWTYDGSNKVCTKQVDCPSGGSLQYVNGQWRCVAPTTSTEPIDWTIKCPPRYTFYSYYEIYGSWFWSVYYGDVSANPYDYASGDCSVFFYNSSNCTYLTCPPRSYSGGCYFQSGAWYSYYYGGFLGLQNVCIRSCSCDVRICGWDYCDCYPPSCDWVPPQKGDPICPQGQYPNSQTGMCMSCPSGYTYDPQLNLCIAEPCPSGSTYNPTVRACTKGPSCIQGGSLNQVIGKCEGSASCSMGATLTSDGCFMGYFCPYGNYPCKPVNGVMMCSGSQCLTASQLQALEEDDPDEPSDYIDDGAIDSAGQCLGQVYIFNGQKHRCRPSGWRTGFKNCCSSSLAKNKIYDSTGSTGATFALLKFGADAIRHAYDMVYLGYLFASGNTYLYFGSMGVILSKSADFANPIVFDMSSKQAGAIGYMLNQMGIRSNAEGIFTVVGGDQAVANAMGGYANAIGPTMALAITHLAISGLVQDPQLAAVLNLAADAIFFYLFPSLMSPIGIAAAVVKVIMSFFMGGGCDREDIITVTKRESGRCHYVGERCIKRLRLGFVKKCIQKAKFYCCFNSKLARIIHQQGRPQLNTDIRNWGSAKHPNCRGFTPEEFASLDFDKIDLSEYFADITRNIPNEFDIQRHVQEYFYGSVGQRVSN